MKLYNWLPLIRWVFRLKDEEAPVVIGETWLTKQPASTELMEQLYHLFRVNWRRYAYWVEQVMATPEIGRLADVCQISPSVIIYDDSVNVRVLIVDPHDNNAKIAEVWIVDPARPICLGVDFYPVFWYAPRQYNEKEILRPLSTLLDTILEKEYNVTTTNTTEQATQDIKPHNDLNPWAELLAKAYKRSGDGFLGGEQMWERPDTWAYIRKVSSQNLLELSIGRTKKKPGVQMHFHLLTKTVEFVGCVDTDLLAEGWVELNRYIDATVQRDGDSKVSIHTAFQLLRQSGVWKVLKTHAPYTPLFVASSRNRVFWMALGNDPEKVDVQYKLLSGNKLIAQGYIRNCEDSNYNTPSPEVLDLDDLIDYVLALAKVEGEHLDRMRQSGALFRFLALPVVEEVNSRERPSVCFFSNINELVLWHDNEGLAVSVMQYGKSIAKGSIRGDKMETFFSDSNTFGANELAALFNAICNQDPVQMKEGDVIREWPSMPGAELQTTFPTLLHPEPEPLLLCLDTGELTDTWVQWYAKTHDCTFARAVTVGLQHLETLGNRIIQNLQDIKKGEQL